jgi:hypothetical protein
MRTNYLETFWHAMHLDNPVPGLGFPSNIPYLVSITDCHVSNWNEGLKHRPSANTIEVRIFDTNAGK